MITANEWATVVGVVQDWAAINRIVPGRFHILRRKDFVSVLEHYGLSPDATGRAEMRTAVWLALACLVVWEVPVPDRPADFHRALCAHLAGAPGLAEMPISAAADLTIAALLSWPLAHPITATDLDTRFKERAQTEVLWKVSCCIARCKYLLERYVLGLKQCPAWLKVNFELLARQITQALCDPNRRGWTALQALPLDDLKGNAQKQVQKQLRQWLIAVWDPRERIKKSDPSGSATYTLQSFIERAVLGFVGDNWKPKSFPIGMLCAELAKPCGLRLVKLARWECSAHRTVFTRKCPQPKCPYDRDKNLFRADDWLVCLTVSPSCFEAKEALKCPNCKGFFFVPQGNPGSVVCPKHKGAIAPRKPRGAVKKATTTVYVYLGADPLSTPRKGVKLERLLDALAAATDQAINQFQSQPDHLAVIDRIAKAIDEPAQFLVDAVAELLKNWKWASAVYKPVLKKYKLPRKDLKELVGHDEI